MTCVSAMRTDIPRNLPMNKKRMPKGKPTTHPTGPTNQSFAELLSCDSELSTLRATYAPKTVTERRAAAEWAYDESLSTSLFEGALARLQGRRAALPGLPPGFVALAIDPEYAPALLTVGCHEHGCGRHEEGTQLLLQLARLSPDTEDWVEIIDKAGQALINAGDAVGTCRLYEAALKACPKEQEFITGMGWALCRAGKPGEALPWLERAVANAPSSSEVLNDYGWALVEAGRFDEAQKTLEKAAQLAPADYTLPANNLKRLGELRKSGQP
jgi:tetratricopeptide (TPR) repeat protein